MPRQPHGHRLTSFGRAQQIIAEQAALTVEGCIGLQRYASVIAPDVAGLSIPPVQMRVDAAEIQ